MEEDTGMEMTLHGVDGQLIRAGLVIKADEKVPLGIK